MRKVPHPSVQALAAIADRMTRDLDDHPTAKQMQAEVRRLHSGLAALHAVAVNRSPLDTQAAHQVKVANMARKYDRQVTDSTNRVGDIFRSGVADVQRRIDEKVKLKPLPFEEAKEIREVVRNMKSADRLKLIGEWINENRGPELAAILKAKPILTGLNEETRANLERSVLGKHAGDEVDELKKLDEVLNGAFAAQRTAGNFVKDLTDPSKLAEIERGAAAAKRAGDDFDEATA